MADETLRTDEMLQSAESFEEAYQSHASSIYKFLFWRTNDVHLSEDLTSTTFQKAWISRNKFHGGSVRSWLQRIARNTLIDHWRKYKEYAIGEIAEESDCQPTLDERLDTQLEIDTLQKALRSLPADMQAVIKLRFMEGLSARKAAKRLGTSEGNVRIMQYRALKKLKERL